MRLTTALLFVCGASAILAGACGGGSGGPKAGEERGPCYGNGSCNPGLTCASNTCVNVSGSGGASGQGGGAGTMGSAGAGGSGGAGAQGGSAQGGSGGAAGDGSGGVG